MVQKENGRAIGNGCLTLAKRAFLNTVRKKAKPWKRSSLQVITSLCSGLM